MARVKFTADRVRKFPHPSSGQVFYWDSIVRGLGIRVTPSLKSYIFQARMDGKSLRIKIGDTKTWVIDSTDPKVPGARQEARRLQSLVDQGIDPRIEKQERLKEIAEKKAASSRKDTTVAKAWEEYLEDRKSHWSERHYNDHVKLSHLGGIKKKRGKGKTVPGVLASLMGVKLSDLTKIYIQNWLEKESISRPGQTRLAFALLRAFTNWCERRDTFKGLADPAVFSNPEVKENFEKQTPKEGSVEREQIKAWFTTVQKIPNKVIAAYLQTLILTGARREELLNLKWVDVDFTWQSMIIKDKVENTRRIPLTPFVSNLLINLPRRNKWVFSSKKAASGRLQEPRKAHNTALAEAGLDGLTIHDLRRSFSNLSEWVETPVGIVYQIMGHKPSATAEKHYKKRPLDLLRMWHVKIEEWILEQAGIDIPTEGQETTPLKLVKRGSK